MKRLKLDYEAELAKTKTTTDEEGNEVVSACAERAEETIKITKMILLGIDEYTNTEACENYIRVMLGATTKDHKRITLTHFLKPDPNDADIVQDLKKSEVFVGGGMPQRNMNIIDFFCDDDEPAYATDFSTVLNMKKSQDEFIGSITEKDFTTIQKFAVNDNIRVGIEILERCLAGGDLSLEAINEIDRWLAGVPLSDVDYKVATKFNVNLISKPVKRDSDKYVGIVSLQIDCLNNKREQTQIQAVMSYMRSTKIRGNSDKVVKLALLESVAKEYYSIGSYSAISVLDGDNAMRLIAYSEKENKFAVITCTPQVYDQFIEAVQSI